MWLCITNWYAVVDTAWPPNLQLIGSKALGGAERWFQRFAQALAVARAPAALGIRAGSALAPLAFGGLPVYKLPFLSVWDPWSRSAITKLLRITRPALVQTYLGRATRLTRTRGRAVHLARLGGYYPLAPYRHADAWLGNTRGLCDWLVAQGLPAARVYHIYNFAPVFTPCPDSVLATLRAELGLPPTAWVLLALGRLVPIKGYQELVAAVARLPSAFAGRDWRLVLLGDGPLRAALVAQARHMGVAGRIHWVGWQNDPGPYLQLADLVIFPSREAETLGNVILEAWSAGCALVTTRFRGARELVRHGEDAWTVPCADPVALAHGISDVLRDESLRTQLARQGRMRVATEFAPATIMAQYRMLYQELVG